MLKEVYEIYDRWDDELNGTFQDHLLFDKEIWIWDCAEIVDGNLTPSHICNFDTKAERTTVCNNFHYVGLWNQNEVLKGWWAGE